MKLTFETTQQYTGLPETTITVPLDNKGATAEVKITRLLNLEMKTDILFYMGKTLEAFAKSMDENLEDEELASELTGHALILALLHVATDVELPPIEDVEDTLTMYRWLLETQILDAILAEMPPNTTKEILDFVNLTVGETEKRMENAEQSGGVSPTN